jgi:cation efflux system protein involved in nickel and cobalt tolerance
MDMRSLFLDYCPDNLHQSTRLPTHRFMTRNNSLRKVEQSYLKGISDRFRWFRGSRIWQAILITGVLLSFFGVLKPREDHSHHHDSPFGHLPDLAMSGGDAHVRALMRTISASESNGKDPYILLYGGKHTHDLGQHPDLCMPITVGVNYGDCSTAAGRYQFLTSTWVEKASRYHPNPLYEGETITYSFEPEYQDVVIYQWLKDEQIWSVNIAERLKQGEINEVLQLLSGTWTSLGSGIEDNSMTPYLAEIYQQVLAKELQRSQP